MKNKKKTSQNKVSTPRKKKGNQTVKRERANEGFLRRAKNADPNTETFLVTSIPVPKPEQAKESKEWEPTTEDDFAKIIEWFSNQRYI